MPPKCILAFLQAYSFSLRVIIGVTWAFFHVTHRETWHFLMSSLGCPVKNESSFAINCILPKVDLLHIRQT